MEVHNRRNVNPSFVIHETSQEIVSAEIVGAATDRSIGQRLTDE